MAKQAHLRVSDAYNPISARTKGDQETLGDYMFLQTYGFFFFLEKIVLCDNSLKEP